MRVTTKISWDIETMSVVEIVSSDYTGPWELLKESEAEKQAQAQQQAFSQQLMETYNTQFQEQQAILKTITPQLEAMATNPEGFGSTEYAALQAQIINDTGAQFSNAAKTEAQNFATTNEAGLPSGVQASVQAELAGAAAGQVSAQSTGLAVANEQLKQQQQQFALSTLGGESSAIGSEAGQTAGQVNSGTNAAFNEASTIYNQGSMWKNILGGLAGSAINAGTTMLGMAVPGAAGNAIGGIGV